MKGRPEHDEAAPYYFTYIDQVQSDDVLGLLAAQLDETLAFLSGHRRGKVPPPLRAGEVEHPRGAQPRQRRASGCSCSAPSGSPAASTPRCRASTRRSRAAAAKADEVSWAGTSRSSAACAPGDPLLLPQPAGRGLDAQGIASGYPFTVQRPGLHRGRPRRAPRGDPARAVSLSRPTRPVRAAAASRPLTTSHASGSTKQAERRAPTRRPPAREMFPLSPEDVSSISEDISSRLKDRSSNMEDISSEFEDISSHLENTSPSTEDVSFDSRDRSSAFEDISSAPREKESPAPAASSAAAAEDGAASEEPIDGRQVARGQVAAVAGVGVCA